jgi:hypothetical protein
MKKSETKTSKPAATRAKVPRAFDTTGRAYAADWLEWTPFFEYELITWRTTDDEEYGPDESRAVEEIRMTIGEYQSLKKHLATMRRGKPAVAVPAGIGDSYIGEYHILDVWKNGGECDQDIWITPSEYDSLKQHLGSMRAKPRRGKAAA